MEDLGQFVLILLGPELEDGDGKQVDLLTLPTQDGPHDVNAGPEEREV